MNANRRYRSPKHGHTENPSALVGRGVLLSGMARPPVDYEHRGVHGPGAEPVQGFLAGLMPRSATDGGAHWCIGSVGDLIRAPALGQCSSARLGLNLAGLKIYDVRHCQARHDVHSTVPTRGRRISRRPLFQGGSNFDAPEEDSATSSCASVQCLVGSRK